MCLINRQFLSSSLQTFLLVGSFDSATEYADHREGLGIRTSVSRID